MKRLEKSQLYWTTCSPCTVAEEARHNYKFCVIVDRLAQGMWLRDAKRKGELKITKYSSVEEHCTWISAASWMSSPRGKTDENTDCELHAEMIFGGWNTKARWEERSGTVMMWRWRNHRDLPSSGGGVIMNCLHYFRIFSQSNSLIWDFWSAVKFINLRFFDSEIH